MSEQDRARLYDWVREHAGEEPAEYLMSCIASVPLTELATKDSVETVKDSVERLEQRFDKMEALREADRAEAKADREADRKKSTWFVAAVGAALSAQILGAHFGWIPSGS